MADNFTARDAGEVAEHAFDGALDHYLARVGYSSQQSDGLESTSRLDNLWTPVAGDHGAHGRFDAHARSASPQLWANTHGGLLGAGAMACLAAAALVLGEQRRRRSWIRAPADAA